MDSTIINTECFDDTQQRPNDCECQIIGPKGLGTSLERISTSLKRQPTKYPHGLNITVQTFDEKNSNADDSLEQNYSAASTLQSDSSKVSWSASLSSLAYTTTVGRYQQQKYRINVVDIPETFSELQVHRSKYPLAANYYLNAQDGKQSPIMLLEYAKRPCRWRCLRWPTMFLTSVVIFFGLITYCLWLHDISVERQKYFQRQDEATSTYSSDFVHYEKEENKINPISTANTVEVQRLNTTTFTETTRITTTTKNALNKFLESTKLRAIDTKKEKKQEYDEPQSILTTEYNYYDNDYETLPNDDSDGQLQPADSIRFTAKHQNIFGLPIKHEERVLKELFPAYSSSTPPTVKEMHRNVSPTIPPIASAIISSKSTTATTTPQENGCFSTTLSMCQGVLDYDLTYNASTGLLVGQMAAMEKLIDSNCSARAVEFICTVLEPECRPLDIGKLPPCRRICKAILEACSIIIVNSDTLTELFDCNLYPDSSDPYKCEDPTRRHDYCYDKEFQCKDSTCIPNQWHCDNIKDCSTGEDEEQCLVCEKSDEFRCRSNEKCVLDSARCDLKYDCFDGSDESDCEHYGSEEDTGFDESELHAFPRIFSYASFLSPNQTNDKLHSHLAATTELEFGKKIHVYKSTNQTSGVSQEENLGQGEGSPKTFVNFRDSKEIMMTSDSETKFKYSSARVNRTTNKSSLNTRTLKPAASHIVTVTTSVPNIATNSKRTTKLSACAAHQLRCVSGKCITVNQLCDKIIDCPDGSDEHMCIYRDRLTNRHQNINSTKSFSSSNGKAASSIPNLSVITTTQARNLNNGRIESRTIRTTIKRKTKS